MKRTNQYGLPLFDWQPPVQVIAFPLEKRIGKVRRVAEVMSRQRTKNAEDAYFQNIDDGLKAQLLRSGVEPSKINAELDAFWNQVSIEMDKTL